MYIILYIRTNICQKQLRCMNEQNDYVNVIAIYFLCGVICCPSKVC